ncbi:MAG: hypothetical protein ACR2JF_16300 [Iamia sp.]
MPKPPTKPDTPGKVPILIDGVKVHAPRGTLTGAEIRSLVDPPVGADRDLWLDREGTLDDLVDDDEKIGLRPQMRFFTVPRVINPGARHDIAAH